MDRPADRVRVATPRAARAIRDPVIAVFVLAGIFEILSGDPVVHAIVLFSVPIALVWDGIRSHGASARAAAPVVEDTPREVQTFRAVPRLAGATRAALGLSPGLVAAALSYAVVVGTFARWSWPASIVVGLTGAFGVAVAWRTPNAQPAPPGIDRAGATAWIAVFVSLGLWELTTLLLQPSLTTSSWAHPTLSTLMDPVLGHHAGRAIALFIWLALGRVLLLR